MPEQIRVLERMEGRHPMPLWNDYPLLPGDILTTDGEGTWAKQAPGLGILGFVLSNEDVAERCEPAPDVRWVIG